MPEEYGAQGNEVGLFTALTVIAICVRTII
jgi:hypothetical protein